MQITQNLIEMGQLIRVSIFTKGEDKSLELTAEAKTGQIGYVMAQAVESFETVFEFSTSCFYKKNTAPLFLASMSWRERIWRD